MRFRKCCKLKGKKKIIDWNGSLANILFVGYMYIIEKLKR